MNQSTSNQQPNHPFQSQPTPQQSQPLTSKPNLPPWASILIISIIAVLIISLVSYLAYRIFTSQSTEEPDEVFCVADAKLCPDGSSVGRIPPACQFAECPKEKGPIDDNTSDWQTYRNEEYGFEMRYPKSMLIFEKSDYVEFWDRDRWKFVESTGGIGTAPNFSISFFNKVQNINQKWIEDNLGLYQLTSKTRKIDNRLWSIAECKELCIPKDQNIISTSNGIIAITSISHFEEDIFSTFKFLK